MDDLFPNRTYQLEVLTWLGATELLAATADLFKNDLTVGEATLEASLTLADFSGYAQKVITWHLPSITDDGTPELVSNQVTWRPTSSVIQNTVFGLFIKTGGGTYLAPGNFVGTFMGATTDELSIVIRWRLGERPQLVVVS